MFVRLVAGATALTLLASCSTTATTSTAAVASSSTVPAGTGLFDSSVVHTVSIDYDEAAYQAMIDTYVASGDKEWISATVTIDGTVFDNVGIKLKGNSTLQGLRTSGNSATTGNGGQNAGAGQVAGGPGGDVSADEPEGLPWRIRLDKYVDGQNFEGETDIVVRGGRTETSLNEAVALELIGAAGMPTEEATPARFTVNGSAGTLRLVIQNPDDDWDSDNFDSEGILYKAEAGGDYSYRGDDPASYADVFSVEASTSGEDDYTPLIAFLKFLNESDDATFAAELGNHIDVQSFADYLAIQDLVANSDDIDGPGNNSYLRYDAGTGLFTVVAWDQNLSFSSMGGMGGGMGGPGQMGARPNGATTDTTTPDTTTTDGTTTDGTTTDGTTQPKPGRGARPTGAMPDGAAGGAMPGGAGGGGRGGNILAERFKANADFNALYEKALTDLRAELYASGEAQTILDTWTSVLTEQAGDLVSADTVAAEAKAIADQFTAS
jgi:spore coat protein CotH